MVTIADLFVLIVFVLAVYGILWRFDVKKQGESRKAGKRPCEEFYLKNRSQGLLYGGFVAVVVFFIAKILSVTVGKGAQRPFEVLGVKPHASFVDNPGFPSDHSLFVWTLFFTTFFLSNSRNTKILIAFFAFCVCVGRVIALVHTPLDVIGGFLVAGGVTSAFYFPTLVYKLSKLKK